MFPLPNCSKDDQYLFVCFDASAGDEELAEMCFSWLKRRFKTKAKESKPTVKADDKPVTLPKVPKAFYYPAMPKYQPCPQCHGWRKRQEKTLGGANYYCKKCDTPFFVKKEGRY